MIAFLISPLGRALAYGAVILAALGGIYVKGYSDGKAHVRAQWAAAEQNTIKQGDTFRSDANRDVVPATPDRLCDDRNNRDKC